jgi:hypothetical protein
MQTIRHRIASQNFLNILVNVKYRHSDEYASNNRPYGKLIKKRKVKAIQP